MCPTQKKEKCPPQSKKRRFRVRNQAVPLKTEGSAIRNQGFPLRNQVFLHGTNPKMCWNQASAKRNQGLSRLLYIIFHYPGMDRKAHGNPPVFRPDLLPSLYSFRILRRGRSFLLSRRHVFLPLSTLFRRGVHPRRLFFFFSKNSARLKI